MSTLTIVRDDRSPRARTGVATDAFIADTCAMIVAHARQLGARVPYAKLVADVEGATDAVLVVADPDGNCWVWITRTTRRPAHRGPKSGADHALRCALKDTPAEQLTRLMATRIAAAIGYHGELAVPRTFITVRWDRDGVTNALNTLVDIARGNTDAVERAAALVAAKRAEEQAHAIAFKVRDFAAMLRRNPTVKAKVLATLQGEYDADDISGITKLLAEAL
jgi:hypothetical protein